MLFLTHTLKSVIPCCAVVILRCLRYYNFFLIMSNVMSHFINLSSLSNHKICFCSILICFLAKVMLEKMVTTIYCLDKLEAVNSQIYTHRWSKKAKCVPLGSP